jgi:type IV secretory pathway protease TraF
MRRQTLWAGLALAGVALIAASFLPRQPLFVWNFTANAPVGLYRTLPRPLFVPVAARGDWVAVEPSPALRAATAELGVLERGRLLVKRVAAASGDEACREGAEVRINGVLTVTARLARSSGAPLPSWSGCRRLGPEDIFLLGQADGSFDGRYFGVTNAREIVAPLALQAAIGGPQARN